MTTVHQWFKVSVQGWFSLTGRFGNECDVIFHARYDLCFSEEVPPPSPFTLMGRLYGYIGSCVQRAAVSFTLRPSCGSEARHKGQETPVSRSLSKAVSEGVLPRVAKHNKRGSWKTGRGGFRGRMNSWEFHINLILSVVHWLTNLWHSGASGERTVLRTASYVLNVRSRSWLNSHLYKHFKEFFCQVGSEMNI